jgi:hypothetical protein
MSVTKAAATNLPHIPAVQYPPVATQQSPHIDSMLRNATEDQARNQTVIEIPRL